MADSIVRLLDSAWFVGLATLVVFLPGETFVWHRETGAPPSRGTMFGVRVGPEFPVSAEGASIQRTCRLRTWLWTLTVVLAFVLFAGRVPLDPAATAFILILASMTGHAIVFGLANRETRRQAASQPAPSTRTAVLSVAEDEASVWLAAVDWLGILLPLGLPLASLAWIGLRWNGYPAGWSPLDALKQVGLAGVFGISSAATCYCLRFCARSSGLVARSARESPLSDGAWVDDLRHFDSRHLPVVLGVVDAHPGRRFVREHEHLLHLVDDRVSVPGARRCADAAIPGTAAVECVGGPDARSLLEVGLLLLQPGRSGRHRTNPFRPGILIQSCTPDVLGRHVTLDRRHARRDELVPRRSPGVLTADHSRLHLSPGCPPLRTRYPRTRSHIRLHRPDERPYDGTGESQVPAQRNTRAVLRPWDSRFTAPRSRFRSTEH